MDIVKKCQGCGNRFSAGSNRAKFCSDKCKYGEGLCEVCSTPFVKTRGSSGKYCSKRCGGLAARGVVKGAPRPVKKCAHCGGDFTLLKTYSRYCSRECLTASRLKRREEHLGDTPTHCQKCGGPIALEGRLRGQKYCSHACAFSERAGENHPNWQGGRHLDPDGYVRITTPKGRMPEHQVVMEQQLGRELYPHEKVHHKNGIRADNAPDNLELWVKAHPAGQRIEDLLNWVLAHYDREVAAELTRRGYLISPPLL
jgi:hypothetical protein